MAVRRVRYGVDFGLDPDIAWQGLSSRVQHWSVQHAP
jgi:hypothetical protein